MLLLFNLFTDVGGSRVSIIAFLEDVLSWIVGRSIAGFYYTISSLFLVNHEFALSDGHLVNGYFKVECNDHGPCTVKIV